MGSLLKFPYYSGNVKDSICKGHVTLEQFIRANREPAPEVLALFDKIREAEQAGAKEEKSRLKESLFSFTPSVIVNVGDRRRYEGIQAFTGLVQLDFDNELSAPELKQYIFDTYPECVCVYLSPSGRGVKALFKIPIVDTITEYKEYFTAIEHEMVEQGIDSFDHAPFNCLLPLFLSYDSELLYRKDSATWLKKMPIDDIKTFDNLAINKPSFTIPDGGTGFGSAAYYKQITISIFEKKIADIIQDPGHPELRDACLVLGSRVGAGYIDRSEAESLASYAVQHNAYLSRKGESGIQNYIKTALWGINIGNTRPKYYK